MFPKPEYHFKSWFQPEWLSLIVFFLCINQVFSQVYLLNDLEDSTKTDPWINQRFVESNQAHSGNKYAIATADTPFGLGLESEFPVVFQGQNVSMNIEGWVKSNIANDHGLYVITILNKEQTVFWRAINLTGKLSEKDTWASFSETITVPASITKSGKIKAYLWYDEGQDTLAIDDLSFRFDHIKNQSFLPDAAAFASVSEGISGEQLFSNSFYSIFFNRSQNSLYIQNKSGEMLVSNIWLFEAQDKEGKVYNTQSFPELLSLKEKKKRSEIVFSAGTVLIQLRCFQDSPEIKVHIEEIIDTEKIRYRQALVFQSSQKISKVFRSGRKIDTADFQDEYWLAKQGAAFGSDSNSWQIYHTPSVSSLQLKTEASELWVNLDYEKDHPFLHFPLLENERDVFEDHSSSILKPGQVLESNFSFYAGFSDTNLPRFMKNPEGYLSAYVWTEHADFTDIRTNRAVFYGSEEITLPGSAIGGFEKYDIPVTKSVFYYNPDSITNEETSSGKFPGLESAILEDDLFRDFLYQLHETGHEICLHTPEQFSTTPKAMKKSLKYMKRKFTSPTWIDHGYNNGIENNREDIVCDGLNERSNFYSAKLWKKYGVQYFWNTYYEDLGTFDSLTFGEFISKPYFGFGDHIPDPDYFQHPSRTGEFWHWPTKSVLYADNDDLWEFLFNETVLNDFVNGWCVQFNHCYPAWTNPEKGFWFADEAGTIKACFGFNKTLERMAGLRDQGLLNLTTVNQFMDYQLAIENVGYNILQDGSVEIVNKGKQKIKGLSMVTQAKNVLVNEKEPMSKTVNGETIFWFDIQPGEVKTIRCFN